MLLHYLICWCRIISELFLPLHSILQSIRLCAPARDLRHGKSTVLLCCALTMFSTVFLIYLAFYDYLYALNSLCMCSAWLSHPGVTCAYCSLVNFDCLSRILTKLSMLLATYCISYSVSVILVVSMWTVLKLRFYIPQLAAVFYDPASYSSFPCVVCLSVASALICLYLAAVGTASIVRCWL